jgi:hypothetical protein
MVSTKKILKSGIFGAVVFLLAGNTTADVFTFTPDPENLNDLEHDYAYIWEINLGEEIGDMDEIYIESATLSVDGIYDWTGEYDRLYGTVLDWDETDHENMNENDLVTPGGNVYEYYDGQAEYVDYFETGYSGEKTGVYRYYHSTIGGYYMWRDDEPNDPVDMSWELDETSSLKGTNEIAAVRQYADDGWIAIAIDPDCHYYNDGWEFTIVTSSTNVPEPGSVTLLGLGLFSLLGYLWLRKKR